MENYDKKTDENFIKLQKEKENSDKRLLFTEKYMGELSTIFFFINDIFVNIRY